MTDTDPSPRDTPEPTADPDVVLPMDLSVSVPEHDGTRTSFHLKMRDGVRVAVDVWVPALDASERVPTVLRSTRYWRAAVGDPIRTHLGEIEVARWMLAGFALVLVDARGTGASFGTWERPWADDERDDLHEVVDWVVAQPWSDGSVGGYGTSYDGTTAHLLAATGHPAITAVIPRFALFDPYHHIGFPGGVPLDWFLAMWDAAGWTLDGYPDRATVTLPMPLTGEVRTVDDDIDGTLLAAAQREHADNWHVWEAVRGADSRGDLVGADEVRIEAGTPLGRLAELRDAEVPMWLWTSWYDGAYAAASLAQLANPELDVRVTIGPWAHGAGMPRLGSPFDPGAPLEPDTAEQHRQMAAFLRHHAVGDVADPSPARLHYYTIGEEAWHEADGWPPDGVVVDTRYLGAAGLVEDPEHGTTRYDVDFDASSGPANRWHTLLGGMPVRYPDRAEADQRLLTWDSEPLPEDLEVTGTPEVTLLVSSSRTDGAFHVYLENVAPDGHVTYVTEGQLRACHRRPGSSQPPYETYGPWHTYESADAELLEPGTETELEFTLWPVSALFRAGHRIRIALAGADAGLFRRVPAEGPVTLDVAHRSSIDLPVRP